MVYRLKTLVGVNVRQGPATTFDVIDTIERDTIVIATEFVKDGGGVGWFRLGNQRYICSKFVTANFKETAKTLNKTKKSTNNKNGVMTIEDDIGGGGGEPDGGNMWDEAVSTFGSYTDSVLGTIKNGILGSASNINSGIFGNVFDSVLGGGLSGDLILSRRLFGAPFQFLETTDTRPAQGNPDAELGIFFQNIMREAPILSLLPGRPGYLANLSTEEKSSLTETLMSIISTSSDKFQDLMKDSLDMTNLDTKYFEFDPQPTDYMMYVNTLCRMCASFMGIGDMPAPGIGIPYKDVRWDFYTMSATYAGRLTQNMANIDLASLGIEAGNTISDVAETLIGDQDSLMTKARDLTGNVSQHIANFNMSSYYIDFYISPPSLNESMTNSTTESMFSNMLGKASNFQKEMAFLFGASGYSSPTDRQEIEQNVEKWKAEADRMLGSSGGSKVISRLLTGATSVITGSNIVFPDLWQDSSFERGYSFEIKLIAPYASKECIFLEIVVPMMHLIAMTLPCQSTANTYSSPFLVRSVLPGFFASEMGIITDLGITKEDWSVDGFPTKVSISLGIKDLYNSLYQSKFQNLKDGYNLLWNTGLIDYLGTLCGLDMKKSEWGKKMDTAVALASNLPSDWVYNAADHLKEAIAKSTITHYIGGAGK